MEAPVRSRSDAVPWLLFGVVGLAFLVNTAMGITRAGGHAAEAMINVVLALITLAAAALLLRVLEEEVEHGALRRRTRNLLFITPRAVALVFVVLLALFAADVFGHGDPLGKLLLALLLHLAIPLAMLAAVIVAWRHEWVGGVLFTAFPVWWLVSFTGRPWPLAVYALMVGFPLVIAGLFLLGWRFRAEVRPAIAAPGR